MRSRGCFPMSRHPLQVDQTVPYYWRQGLWEVPWQPSGGTGGRGCGKSHGDLVEGLEAGAVGSPMVT